ncbi:hypothetical protein BKP64_00245 [Marinobacter salinus]|uniref:Uncharacterized protein n=1 Tax=Marinobacter salinus TaxID=1874317 RepID=A0A1D9GGJ9_9GAMM|nr:hypothetical protein [Marinobacter salinus]AOY86729.1 hypothetical protein BKP64_00245 [Marinobacter salinus]
MRWSRPRHYLLPPLLFLTLSSGALAQSAEELLKEIDARKERINQFRALLNDPDQSTRLAALDVMLKSDDLAMKEVAYGIGFNSADEATRALALKGKFRDVKVLPFRLTTGEPQTDTEKNTIRKWAGAYGFELREFNEDTGQFTFRGDDYPNRDKLGQVNGTGVEFQAQYCRGYFNLGDSASLVGELRCTGPYEGTYPAKARLH